MWLGLDTWLGCRGNEGMTGMYTEKLVRGAVPVLTEWHKLLQ